MFLFLRYGDSSSHFSLLHLIPVDDKHVLFIIEKYGVHYQECSQGIRESLVTLNLNSLDTLLLDALESSAKEYRDRAMCRLS